jgi:AcrR family transcriptional regulator
MGNYRKGLEMRQSIIQEARKIFNKEGLQLTLDQIAQKLGITKGRITNYFPNKDNLFVALSQDYDLRFQELMASFGESQEISFDWLATVYSAIMDLQYEHRSTIIFAATTSSGQKEMHEQVTHSYKTNSKQVSQMVNVLVDEGLIKPELQKPGNFDVFCFQHVNLFTTWVISKEIYYSTSSYKKMKPVYLKGIFGCYYPYLTTKGLAQYQMLFKC